MTFKILLKLFFILNCIVFISSAAAECDTIDNSAIATQVYSRSTTSTSDGTPEVRFDKTSSSSIQYYVKSKNPIAVAGTETILQFQGTNKSKASYNNDSGSWAWSNSDKGLLVTDSDCTQDGVFYKCDFVEYTVRNCEVSGVRPGKVLIFDKQEFSLYLVFDFLQTYTFTSSLANYENDVILRTTYGCPDTFDSDTEKCYTTEIISIDSSSLTVAEHSGDGNFRFGDTALISVGIDVTIPLTADLDLETDNLKKDIYNSLDHSISVGNDKGQVKLVLSEGSNSFSRNAFVFDDEINDTYEGIQFKIEMNMTGGVYDFSDSSEYILGSGDSATIDIEFTLEVSLDGFDVNTNLRDRLLQSDSTQIIRRDFSYRIENFDPESLNEFLQEIRQSLNLDELNTQDEPEPEAKDDKTLTIILATVLTFFGVLAIIITLVCLLRKRQDPGKPINCESEVRNSKSKDITDNRAHIQDASEQI